MYTRPELFLIILVLWLASVEADNSRPLTSNSHNNNHHRPLSRPKRMYAMCPPQFVKLGSECYYFSTKQANWLEAHFECRDKNSRLAEPQKHEDRLLRKFLMQNDRNREEKWIGGNYNWELKKWLWGYTGNEIKYQSFSRMKPGQSTNLKFQCAALNPGLKYKWSAKYCTESHYYICQHTMPYVSEYNRNRIYQKWNTTFPNELANEIEIVLDGDNQERTQRQRESYKVDQNEIPKKRRPMRKRPAKKPRVHDVSTNDVVQPVVAYAEDPLLGVGHSNGYHKRKPHYPIHVPPTTTTTTTTTVKPTTTKKVTKKPRRHYYKKPTTPKSTTTTTTTTTPKPTTTTISPEEVQRDHKKQQLLDRFNRLTPDEQREFLKRKKDRQRQKLAMKKVQNETIP